MSTRAQVIVDGTGVYLYQHSDGYPSYMLKTLIPYVAEFMKQRGWDPEFLAARLMHAMIERGNREQAEREKTYDADMLKNVKVWHYIGYGLDAVKHDDVEYFYYVTERGAITVEHAGGVMTEIPHGTTYAKAMKMLPADQRH